MTPQQHIRNIYGFDFPEDFFEFYEFAERINTHPDLKGKYGRGLSHIGMSLCSPFDVCKPDFNPETRDIIKATRYDADPPEFFTILHGDTDGLHWGYYVDAPSEQPTRISISKYYSNDAFQLGFTNETLFEIVRIQLERHYNSVLEEIRTEDEEYAIKYNMHEQVKQLDLIRTILLEYGTAEHEWIGNDFEENYEPRKNRFQRQPIATTRCDMGIVADKALYQPLRGIDKFQIWNYVPSENEVHQLHEKAIAAISNGFPATALKIGKDLWVYSQYNRIMYEILYAAYGALNRPILQKVVQNYCMAKSFLTNEDFQKALEAPEEQTYLSWNWKKMSELPTQIKQFKNLKTLGLGSNELEYLPDELAECTQLEHLSLNNNNFTTIPAIIGELTNLKYLNLSGNAFKELPDNFAQLQNLEELYIKYPQITEFPKVICSLKNLKKLYINNVEITTLPDELNQLENLEELRIRVESHISKYPKNLKNLTKLKKLHFYSPYCNDVKPIPFPKSFCDLVNLEELEISRFFEYPDEMAQLQKLTYLQFGNYEMTEIPTVIFKLNALKKLSCACSRLTNLPKEITQLTALEEIYLHGNRIKQVPTYLKELPNLKDFDIGYNCLTKLEIERLKALLPDIKLTYWHQHDS